MTGSGSAFFAVFGSRAERDRAEAVLKGDRVFEGVPGDSGDTGEPAELPAAVAAAVGGTPVTADHKTIWPPQSRYAAMRFNHFKIFTGNANPALAAEICYELGCQLAAANVKQFSDGEIHLQIQENVRGADVFVVQPTCTPGGPPPDGTAADDRRAEARLSGAHHGSVTLLWVRAAGS